MAQPENRSSGTPPAPGPVIQAMSVSCYFGKSLRVPALRDISLAIGQGDEVYVTGPSGSGKTTLLNVIGGLQEPTSGALFVLGQELYAMTARELTFFRARRIGFVFQSPNLIPVLSAAENVMYALKLARPELSQRAAMRETLDVMRFVQLESKQRLRPAQLSGGECQRVAIARAIVKRPSLILADEPTSHLDDDNAGLVATLFSRLSSEHRSTIVIATHDARLLSLALRKIRLEEGRIASSPMPEYQTAEAML